MSTELNLKNYYIYRNDRNKHNSIYTEGGGVLLAINKNLNSYELDYSNDAEHLFVHVSDNNGLDVIVSVCYLPPTHSTPDVVMRSHCSTIDHLDSIFPNSKWLIFGDYNSPKVRWDKGDFASYPIYLRGCANIDETVSQILFDSISLLNLFQLNNVQNENGVILDLIFSDFNCVSCNLADEAIEPIDRHHPPVNTLFCYSASESTLDYEDWVYNFESANFDQIAYYLGDIFDQLNSPDLAFDDALDLFYCHLYNCIELYVPRRRITNESSNFPSWYSRELRTNLIKKKIAHIRFKNVRSTYNYNAFSELRRTCKTLARRDFSMFNRVTEQSLIRDPASFWKYVNSKRESKGLPNIMHYDNNALNDGKAIVDAFADYFKTFYKLPSDITVNLTDQTPLNLNSIDFTVLDIYKAISNLKSKGCVGPDGVPPILLKKCPCIFAFILKVIFDKSLAEGIFPDLWKLAFVSPIHKSGPKNLITNYRPISLLSVIPKLFESIIVDKIKPLIYTHISPKQFGFVGRRNIEANLSSLTHYIMKSLNEKKRVDCIYTDFSKAFDSVNHNILIQKLQAFGFSGSLLNWLSNYLVGRIQLVKYKNFISNPIYATSGVPQGSHLGPLLFIIFINDITTIIKNVELLLFADDLKLCKSIKTIHDKIDLQESLDILYNWCVTNDLNLNIQKCKSITFSRSKTNIMGSYFINDIQLEIVDQMRDLGVIFDNKMTFKQHIYLTVNKGYLTLGFVRRQCRQFRNPQVLLTLYNSLVKPLLTYSSVVWSPFQSNFKIKLERVQHRFFRIIAPRLNLPDPYLDHDYHKIANVLQVPTLTSVRMFKEALFLFKLCNSFIDCPYLLGTLNFKVPTVITRNNVIFAEAKFSSNYTSNEPINRMCKLINDNRIDLYCLDQQNFARLSKNVLLDYD